LDSSLTLGWHFEDERSPADELLDRVAEEGAYVPSIRRLEVANGLQVSIRRKRFDAAFRDNALAKLAILPSPLMMKPIHGHGQRRCAWRTDSS